MPDLLSMEALRALPDDIMAVEGDTSIYFLWDGDELLYIGASNHSAERIGRHIRERNQRAARGGLPVPFSRYTFLEVDQRELWWLENQYLRQYATAYNEIGPRKRRYY